MKHFAILPTAMLLAANLCAVPINPYPNEINGLNFYARYLAPLLPNKSDHTQVVQVLGAGEKLELKDWRIGVLYSCAEDFLTCSHGPRNDPLDTIVVTPKHRVSLRRFKFPPAFSHSYGQVSEVNVTCGVFTDEFGLEYWVISRDFPSHKKGELLEIRYGPRRAADQSRVQH